MEIIYNEIAERALRLPAAKRVSLAKCLLESVQGSEDAFPPMGAEVAVSGFPVDGDETDSASDIEKLWAEEALRRLEEYRAGRSVAVEADEVFRRVSADMS